MRLSTIIVYFLALLYPLLATENAVYDAEKMSLNEVMYYFQLFLKIYSKIILVSASLH